MGRRNDIDWEAIERAYRLGQLSVRAIAKQHGVQPSSITRKAEKQAWARDLSAEVRARTRAGLLANATESNAATRESLEAAVATNIELIRQHRIMLGRGRRVTEKLLDELEQTTDSREEIEAAIEEETAADKGTKRRTQMLKAVSLPSRSQAAAALSTATRNLVTIERQAFNLNEPGDDGDGDGAGAKVVIVPPKEAGSAPTMRPLEKKEDLSAEAPGAKADG